MNKKGFGSLVDGGLNSNPSRYGINSTGLSNIGYTGATPTEVWILSSATPLPVTQRGVWDDTANWSDSNIWND